jgi:Ca2+-binding RTX toxin-like protein
MSRKTTVALVAAVLLALLTAGAALAATIECPISGVCQGTNNDDTMNGTPGSDQIDGGDGNDDLNGDGGNDTLNGDPGNDSVTGGLDNDTVNGGLGNDMMWNVDGTDEVFGEAGNDEIWVDDPRQTVVDTGGVDTASGGPGNDTITANATIHHDARFEDHIDCGPGGKDIARLDNGLDSVIGCEKLFHFCPPDGVLCQGTNNDDTMYGTPGSDEMPALDGNDDLNGDADNDTLNGGDGNDSFDGGDGNDTVNGGLGNDEMWGELVNSPGNDELFGEAGNDKISATQDVTASGGPGNDVIVANDRFQGDVDCGPGNRDIVYFDEDLDSVIGCEWRNSYPEGRVLCTESPWLGDKPIWCIDGTAGDDKLVGKVDPDVIDSIWGDIGDDTLKGRSGDDALVGWSGNDILMGGDGSDWLFGDDNDRPEETAQHGDPAKPYGNDEFFGQAGNDFFGAIDGKKDTISCGSGRDYVQRDKGIDKVANDCERIRNTGEPKYHWYRGLGNRKRR